ncbi:MAG: hypothetical protein HY554_11690, partial [Elusimicrobia bacterium]|nr:hypothetical protein [Elusimicrobiota bacterium]
FGEGAPADHRFYARARSHDASKLGDGSVSASTGNASAWTAPRSFVVDPIAPVSSLTWPVNGIFAAAISSITGTADAGLSGLQKVEVKITTNNATGPWWNGSGWTFAEIWRPATLLGQTGWSYPGAGDTLANAFTDHNRYLIYSRATDLATNEESAPPAFAVDYDTSAPSLAILRPVTPPANPPYSNLPVLDARHIKLASGTVSDPGPLAAGVASVWIAVSSGSAEGLWWNPANGLFDIVDAATIRWATQVYTGGVSWSTAPAAWAGVSFADGASYRLHAKACDAVGNCRNDATSPLASTVNQFFRYDASRPTATVSVPLNGSDQRSVPVFSGNSQDPGGGMRRLYAAVQHTGGTAEQNVSWWNWATGQFDSGITTPGGLEPPGAAWTEVANTSAWDQLTLAWSTPVPAGMLLSSNTYRVVVAAIDQAGNVQLNPDEAGAGSAFRYDVSSPTVRQTLPVAGAYLSQPSLGQLAGTAFDEAQGSGLERVEVLLKIESLEATWDGGTVGTFDDDWDNTPSRFSQWRLASGLASWTTGFPSLAEMDSRKFRVWVRATDKAGNQSATPTSAEINDDAEPGGAASSARLFTFDNTPPSSKVTSPAPYISAPPNPAQIGGTSIDAFAGVREPSGVASMWLKYWKSNGEFWSLVNSAWTGTDSLGNTSWNASVSPWSFTNVNTADAFEDGFRYYVISSAIDAAGNVEVNHATYTFIVDRSTPISNVTFPRDGGYIGTALTLTGDATDQIEVLRAGPGDVCDGGCPAGRTFESGILPSSVTIALQEMFGSNPYWDGSGFNSAVPVWSTASYVGESSGTWTYLLPPGKLTSPRTYKLTSRASDRAGNLQTAVSTVSFIYDVTAPVAVATAPAGTVPSITTLYGTVRDEAPGALDVVYVRIQETECSDPVGGCHFNEYWNGYAWQPGEVWLASGTIVSLVSDTTYTWRMDTASVFWNNMSTFTVSVRGRDGAGNVEAPHAQVDVTFKLETPDAQVSLTQPAPPDLVHYRPNALAINTIVGTALNAKITAAPPPGNAGMRLQLQRLASPASYWFEGNGWTNVASTYTPVTVLAAAPQTWSKALTSPYAVDNASYSLTVTPINPASLPGPAPQARVFIVDNTPPVGAIAVPATVPCAGVDACLNSTLLQLGGTFTDPGNPNPPSILFSGVKARVKRNFDNAYWDPAAGAFGSLTEFGISAANFSFAGSPPTFSWSTSTLAGPKLQDGVEYTLLAHAADKAGNDQSVDEAQMARYTFVFDTSPATAFLVAPSSGQVHLNLAAITGTAVDVDGSNAPSYKSEAAAVELSIRNPDDICWVAGGGFSGLCATTWVPVSGVGSWTYSHATLTANLENGRPYTVAARARDKAGNVQSAFGAPVSSRTFFFDNAPPLIGFTKPADGQAYRASQLTGGSALSGTASDPEAAVYPGSDALQPPQLVIWYEEVGAGTTKYFWTGADFSSATVESAQWKTDVSGSTASWTFLFDGNKWVSDKQYYALARSSDRARDASGAMVGNLTSVFQDGVNWVDFVVDTTAPRSVVQTPVAGSFVQHLDAISGTSNASLSGAQTYSLRIATKDAGGNEYFWNGAAWGAANVVTQLPVQVMGTTGTVAWTFPGDTGLQKPSISQADATIYYIAMQVRDRAGNLETPATIQVVLDRDGPNPVTISTPSAAYPNYGPARPLAELRGGALDSPAGVAYVQVQLEDIADGKMWNGADWVVTASTYMVCSGTNPWTFAAPPWLVNKRYRARARAYDTAGNLSAAPPSVIFNYDVNPPTSAFRVPVAGLIYPQGQPSVLNGTAFDWVAFASTETATGLAKVEVAITDPGGNYWQGTTGAGGFTNVVSWRTVSTTTADPASWTYPPSNPAGDVIPPWQDAVTYAVKLRATDNAGNVEFPEPTRSFTYDAKAPTTTLTSGFYGIDEPANGAFVRATPRFTGPMSDGLSGMARVQVAIRQQGGDFWNGSAFESIACPGDCQAMWRDATPHVSSWTYADAALDAYFQGLNTSVNYGVFAAGSDAAGNVNRSTTTTPDGPDSTFVIDRVRPVSVSTYPTSAAVLLYTRGPVTPIAGTAADIGEAGTDTGGAGISGLFSVKLRVMRLNSAGATDYYNAGLGTWVSGAPGYDLGYQVPMGSLNGVSGPGIANWTSDASALSESKFAEGYLYKIESQARDMSSPSNYELATTTIAFIVDRSSPTAAFVSPPSPGLYISTFNLTFASGTQAEALAGGQVPSGVQDVFLEVQDVSPAPHLIPNTCGGPCQWWDAVNQTWAGGRVSSRTAVYQSSWSFAALPPDWTRGYGDADGRKYAVRVLARDRTGNQGDFAAGSLVSETLLSLDRTRPESGIAVPAAADDAIANSLSALSGTASDPLNGPGALLSSSAVRAVYVSIQDYPLNGGAYPEKGWFWDGTDWNSGLPALGDRIWLPAAWNGVTWSLAGPPDNKLRVNSRYIVISSAADNAGNTQGPASLGETAYKRVQYQPPAAQTGINTPESLAFYSHIEAIQGTANPYTTQIQLTLKRLDTGACWGGGNPHAWVDCVQASTATRVIGQSLGNWTYPPQGERLPDWGGVNNATLTVTSVGYNLAQLPETPPKVSQFYVDRSSPVSSVAFPASDSFVTGRPTPGGPIVDPSPSTVLSGVRPIKGVRMRLRRMDSGYYWDVASNSWVFQETYSTVTYHAAGSSWTFNSSTPSLTWVDGLLYNLDVLGIDQARNIDSYVDNTIQGNSELPAGAIQFIYDSGAPSVSLANPNAPRERSMATIAGVAADAAPGQLGRVQVRVLRESGLQRWANPATGMAFDVNPQLTLGQAELAWTTATYATSWANWSLSSGVAWGLLGDTFTVVARSIDRAGNVSPAYSSYTFIYDDLAPETGVTAPAANAIVHTLTALEGTLGDLPSANPGAVAELRLRVRRLADDNFWTGAAWNAWPGAGDPSSMGANEGTRVWSTSWTVNANNIPACPDPSNGLTCKLTHGASYFLSSSGRDDAADGGNEEAYYTSRGSTITVDLAPPASTVTVPSNGQILNLGSLASIQGTAADPLAGIASAAQVQVMMKETSPGSGTWDGGNPGTFGASGDQWHALTAVGGSFGAGIWSFPRPALSDQASYRVYVRARDNALPNGNLQTAYSSMSFTIDNLLPAVAITFPPTLTAANAYQKGAFTAQGTIADPFGVVFASVALMDLGSGEFYNGAGSFVATGGAPFWLPTTTLAGSAPNYTFTKAFPAGTIPDTDGRKYQLLAKAANTAGDEGT